MSARTRKPKAVAPPARPTPPTPPTRKGAVAAEAEIVRELHAVEWEKLAAANQKLTRAEAAYQDALRGVQDLVEIYTLKDPTLGIDPKRRAVVKREAKRDG